ncbi:MAG: hypothetical protein EOO84_12170 [Pantoea sp.]|uniref:DUF2235 domain-containing protein n=1 Tax=Pantoea TaxID=53335 RepID=UPI00122020AC|nr:MULTISPECIES: DUF2235 domain-containing protein [Pantoea]MDY0902198.1 DUF2235 domain-containing protein [Pantoea agglomerans]RZK06928.1 MAG: hypothetical protein EOO84_12170 [Pantoea sp.]
MSEMRLHQFNTTLLCILISGLLSACSGLVSGSRSIPVKVTDYEEIQKITYEVNNAPLITVPIGNRPVRIYKVAFDGTLNDHTRLPSDERETLVARIAALVQADNYYPGAGMQGKSIDYFDAATGRSGVAIAADAEKKFYTQAKMWLKQNSDTDIRVFVTGFSRGAATARHFINLASNQWAKNFNSHIKSPRFYALLYDTVATGQQDHLNLNIPQSVDYLVHFVATDEPRNLFFVPTLDEDKTPLPLSTQFAPIKRINTIYLPGSHSDIGASYSKGIGDLYITLTEQFLYMMGLAQTNCWESHDDPLLAGKHDSRGGLDVLFGSQNPNNVMIVNRPSVIKETMPLTTVQRKDIAIRLNEMWEANFRRMSGMYVDRTETSLATITLRKSMEGIVPISVSSNIKPGSLTLSPEGDATRLRFRFTMGKSENSLLLKPKVTERIKAEGSKIAFSFLESPADSYMATWVDNQLIELTPMTVSSEAVSEAQHQRCVKQLDGTFRSPIGAMVIGPN